MKKATFLSNPFRLMLIVLLLSNFSAFAQKTTIWIVNHAEKDKKSDALTDTGKMRADDLMKTLKHEGVEVIYVTSKNVSLQTANPLAFRNKILPRVTADSLQKFAKVLTTNFIGKKVLIVADYNTILPLVSALGGDSPFDALDKNDYDQIFTITIKPSGEVESNVRYYGKKHHVTPIPQSYMLDNYTPGLPSR